MEHFLQLAELNRQAEQHDRESVRSAGNRSVYFDRPNQMEGGDAMSRLSDQPEERVRNDMVPYNPKRDRDDDYDPRAGLAFLRRQQAIARAKRRRLFEEHEQEDQLSEMGNSTEDELEDLQNAPDFLQDVNEEEVLEKLKAMEKNAKGHRCLVCRIWLIDPQGKTFIGKQMNSALKLVETGVEGASQTARMSDAAKTINKKVIMPMRGRYNFPEMHLVDLMSHYGIGESEGRPCVTTDELLYETSLTDLAYAKCHLKRNCVYMKSATSNEKSVHSGNMKLLFQCISLEQKTIEHRRVGREAKRKAERQNRESEGATVAVAAEGVAMALTGNNVVAANTLAALTDNNQMPPGALYLAKK